MDVINFYRSTASNNERNNISHSNASKQHLKYINRKLKFSFERKKDFTCESHVSRSSWNNGVRCHSGQDNPLPGQNYSIPSRNWRSKNQEYSPGWGTPIFYNNNDDENPLSHEGINAGSFTEPEDTLEELKAVAKSFR